MPYTGGIGRAPVRVRLARLDRMDEICHSNGSGRKWGPGPAVHSTPCPFAIDHLSNPSGLEPAPHGGSLAGLPSRRPGPGHSTRKRFRRCKQPGPPNRERSVGGNCWVASASAGACRLGDRQDRAANIRTTGTSCFLSAAGAPLRSANHSHGLANAEAVATLCIYMESAMRNHRASELIGTQASPFIQSRRTLPSVATGCGRSSTPQTSCRLSPILVSFIDIHFDTDAVCSHLSGGLAHLILFLANFSSIFSSVAISRRFLDCQGSISAVEILCQCSKTHWFTCSRDEKRNGPRQIEHDFF